MESKLKDVTKEDDATCEPNSKLYLLFTLHLLKVFQSSLCPGFLI